MNIFALDSDPILSARSLCDRHVLSQVKEAAQMLCTVVTGLGAAVPYRPTHPRHPCTLWAGASRANFEWLVAHGLEIASEYRRRYPKRDVEHASRAVIEAAARHSSLLPRGGLTQFACAMPDAYVVPGDPVESYRRYYRGDRARFAAWRAPAKAPEWWRGCQAEVKEKP